MKGNAALILTSSGGDRARTGGIKEGRGRIVSPGRTMGGGRVGRTRGEDKGGQIRGRRRTKGRSRGGGRRSRGFQGRGDGGR